MRRIHSGILAALMPLILVALSCEAGKEQVQTSVVRQREVVPDQVLYGTRITLTELGLTQAIIAANIVKIYEDSSYASLEDSVHIDFFDEEGVHTSTLTADKGEIWGMYGEADSLRASGEVVIRSEEENALMEAPAIRWLTGEGTVYGVGTVKLTTENGFEQGVGFEAKDDLSEYRFRGPVSGEVRSEELNIIDRREEDE